MFAYGALAQDRDIRHIVLAHELAFNAGHETFIQKVRELDVRVLGIARQTNSLAGGPSLFCLMDDFGSLTVTFKGVLPDLFADGLPIIVRGEYKNTYFEADEVIVITRKTLGTYLPEFLIEELMYLMSETGLAQANLVTHCDNFKLLNKSQEMPTIR